MSHFDINDFQTEVIDKSYEKPVLVDFWAEWCQPCKILGPVLESLARERADEFILAKVNTEKHTQIAVQYNISSIPAVKLIVKGEVKAEFVGALSKPMIEKWLDEHVPSEGEKELNDIKSAINQKGFDKKIRKRLAKIIFEEPELFEARVILAKHLLFEEPETAKEFVDPIQADSLFYQHKEAIQNLSGILELTGDDIEKDAFHDNMLKALKAIKSKDFETALENLINIVMINKGYMNGLAQKSCVALFHYLGNDHELTRKYRRRFDMALY